MWRAVATAALMYVHHVMRGHALHWVQFPALVVQLRHELGVAEMRSWDKAPALHVWVLAVGSVASQHEAWVVQMLAEACRVRGFTDWALFEGSLRTCPSMGRRDEEMFARVWEEGVVRLL